MNTRNFFIIAAALLLIAACQSVLEEQIPEESKVTDEIVEDESETKIQAPDITAAQEGDNPSKSVLEVDGDGVGTIYWTPADEINVFYGTTSTHYVSQNTVNATTAVFSTTDIIGSTESASESIWGLYPYNPSATCSGSAVTTTLPATQYGVPGTFDDDLYITLAHNNSTALKFYNVCGGIKFSLSRDDITAITFRGNNDEDIAGDMSISLVEGLPVANVISGAKTITLTPKTGTIFASGEYYYLILLPGTLSTGFTMTFSTTDGSTGTFNYTANPVTIKRSVFGKKATIDSYAIFSLPSNVIKYTSTDGDIVNPNNPSQQFGANVVSNTYENGEGTLIFDAPITALGQSAFSTDASRLQTITLPSSIVSVHFNAFSMASSLTHYYGPLAGADNRSLVIEEKLIDVATKGITSYTIPSGVRVIGRKAFDGQDQITSITIPEGVEIIEQDGLFGTKLSGISLPSTITELGQSWSGGQSIKSITIPASVVSIGKWGAQFRVVEFNSTVPASLGENVFGTSENAIYVPNGTLETYKSAWPEYASRLREKTSSQPLNEIWYTTNDGQPARSDRSNPNIEPSWKQNIVSNDNGKMVFDAPVTVIPYDAFENSNLQTVSLPDAIYYLGNNCFQLSTSLQEVKLGKYLEEMSFMCFDGCSALTSIVIPDNVAYMDNCFFNCTSLSSVTLPENLQRLGSRYYLYDGGVAGLEKNGSSIFEGCTSLKEINLPASLEYIGSRVFMNSGIESITIPAGVTTLESDLFSGCASLKSVTYAGTITSMGDSCFKGCTSLESFVIPSTISEIPNYAFQNCSGLSTIVIPIGITSIGYYAFSDCSSLQTITVLPTTPPSAKSYSYIFYHTPAPIYVPSASVDAYKSATEWSTYASRIQAMP